MIKNKQSLVEEVAWPRFAVERDRDISFFSSVVVAFRSPSSSFRLKKKRREEKRTKETLHRPLGAVDLPSSSLDWARHLGLVGRLAYIFFLFFAQRIKAVSLFVTAGYGTNVK